MEIEDTLLVMNLTLFECIQNKIIKIRAVKVLTTTNSVKIQVGLQGLYFSPIVSGKNIEICMKLYKDTVYYIDKQDIFIMFRPDLKTFIISIHLLNSFLKKNFRIHFYIELFT